MPGTQLLAPAAAAPNAQHLQQHRHSSEAASIRMTLETCASSHSCCSGLRAPSAEQAVNWCSAEPAEQAA